MDEMDTPLLSAGEPGGRRIFSEWIQPCLGEFVGLIIFTFTGVLSVKNMICSPSAVGTGQDDVIGIALVHGLAIAILVTAFAHVSGGHMNPSVSLGVFLGGGMKALLLPAYIVSQCLGSIVGAAFAKVALSQMVPGHLNETNVTVFEHIHGGGQSLAAGVTWYEGLMCEALLTFVLVMSVLHNAVDTAGKHTVAPLTIGFTIVIGVIAGAGISGPSMNPARSFGSAVVLWQHVLWRDHWIYWLGPGLGAALAGLLYRLFFAAHDRRLILKQD